MTQDNNIPQGYKQTEFGPIPLDWELCTFKDVLATFSSGATPYRGIPEYYNGDVRWISSGELNYNHIYDTLEHISQQAVRNTNLRIHKPGTFLMAITGLEAEGTRGRCAFVGAPSATNQSCLAINGTDKLCAEYLFWFYRMWGQYLAFKYCQGTKQQSYTAGIVKKLPIYGPKDIAEQRAIAEALSDVDGLIAALDKKIAKKRLLKQGAMQQLLTGKKRLPGFTDEWVDTPIGEGVRFQVGYPFQSQYFTSDRIGKRLVKNRDLKSDDQIVFYNGEYDYKFIVHNGDILIGMDGDFLPYKWDKGIALLNQRVGRLLPTKKWDLSFVMYALIEPLQKLQDGTGATTVKHLSHNDIEQMVLCIPQNYEEQQAIATIFSDIDKEIANLEAQRDKYRLLKSGMMQKLLTGQIRLKTE